MNKLVQTCCTAVLLLSTPFITQAQETDLFKSLLNQLDSNQLDDYFKNLDELNSDFTRDWLTDSIPRSGVYGDLRDILNGREVPPMLTDSFSIEWGEGLDSLNLLMSGGQIDSSSFVSDLLNEEYIRINGIWNQNFDSLSGIFGEYNDSLYGGLFIMPGDRNTDGQMNNIIDDIRNTQPGELGGSNRINNILNRLFGAGLFSDLELAYGTKRAGVQFYNEGYFTETSGTHMIRIGSVSNFADGLESTWHLATSWTNKTILDPNDDNEVPVESDGYNPFVHDFDYSVRYNYSVIRTHSVVISGYAGVGIEASIYAPTHRNRQFSQRVGFTTGYGPQISTGMAMNFGDFTTYLSGSIARGSVVCRNTLDHDYSSLKFEAGARFKNIINLRYSTGGQSWTADLANNNGKRVDTNRQITIGLILDSLYR